MRWMTSDRYAQQVGISSSLLEEYKKTLFTKGVHYFVRGRTTWIDAHAIDELLGLLASESCEDDARSATPMHRVSGDRFSRGSPTRLE